MALFSHQDTALADVTVLTPAGNRVVLKATENHPFWDEAADPWAETGDLFAGRSWLALPDGTTRVVAFVRRYTGSTTMRDLTVADQGCCVVG